MATIFAHSLVGGTLAAWAPRNLIPADKAFYFWMLLSPIVPDFDYVGYVMRIPYDSLFGHRGMTHSILFALIWAAVIAFLFEYRRAWKSIRFLFYFFATVSHPLLDAMTNGGLGVAFFAPYNQVRYFFPWTPIEVSPMGPRFFSERGLAVIISEIYWIGIPCVFLFVLRGLVSKIRADKKTS